MRIISGTHKGRKIIAPRNLPVRPTTDMAKEALFNILANRIHFADTRVLDLFAGTGNMSFEFASRGSSEITSVDLHPGCVRFIGAKAEEWGLPIRAKRMDVFKYLETATGEYGLIFSDPPYDLSRDGFEALHRLIFERELLSQDGLLIIEHGGKTDLSYMDHFTEARKYSNSKFSFFER
jgi:16S rRNA (guanine(966)-N(2))-methyltransferase RsmD